MKITLITGGVRSGKSRYAQELAQQAGGEVLFVATAGAEDEEMRLRIAAHRKSRPPHWRTLEVQISVGNQITQNTGQAKTVIIDCITLLVNNVLEASGPPEDKNTDDDLLEKAVNDETVELIECMEHSDASFIIVTNEVGLGIVPDGKLGRVYRDLLGKTNQMLAGRADEVIMMVAGIPVRIKPGA